MCSFKLIYTTLMVFFVIACGTYHGNIQQKIANSPEIKFIVGNSHGPMIPGVEVLLIKKNGDKQIVGETDALGAIKVNKEMLLSDGCCILFCHDKFYCGAFIIDNLDLSFDEMLIVLFPVSNI